MSKILTVPPQVEDHRCVLRTHRRPVNASETRSRQILSVTGRDVEVTSEAVTPLRWVLRDELNLVGTKFGCGIAQCGACTVHLDGVAIRSCVTPVSAVADKNIQTIEGQAIEARLSPVQQAWLETDVAQCLSLIHI